MAKSDGYQSLSGCIRMNWLGLSMLFSFSSDGGRDAFPALTALLPLGYSRAW